MFSEHVDRWLVIGAGGGYSAQAGYQMCRKFNLELPHDEPFGKHPWIFPHNAAKWEF